MPRARITDIIIDCVNPELVARFWSALLGREIAGRKGPYVWLDEVPGQVRLSFQFVDDPPAGKGRTHIDLSVPDVLEAASRAKALGGSRATGYDEGGFLVMEDPEGNVFCLVPEGPFNFDEQGRADYLDNPDY